MLRYVNFLNSFLISIFFSAKKETDFTDDNISKLKV